MKYFLALEFFFIIITYNTLMSQLQANELKNKKDQFWQPELSQNIPYNKKSNLTMFRGNPTRNFTGHGKVPRNAENIKELWRYGPIAGPPKFTGIGWTGQPLIINWPLKYRKMMKWNKPFQKTFGPQKEVIFGAGDGAIHFVDFKTGKATRKKFSVSDSPIKGTVTIHPWGLPLLAFGQAFPSKTRIGPDKAIQPCGFYLIDLIKMKKVFFINGLENSPPRRWPAFDSSAVFIPHKDALLTGGENGLFYKINLNTHINENKPPEYNPVLSIYNDPKKEVLLKAQYGIESSIAVWKNNAYYTDNQGILTALNINTFVPLFRISLGDDTDSTIVIDEEDKKPFLYVGIEVDWRGKSAPFKYYKINGLNGKIVWSFKRMGKKINSKKRIDARSGGILGTGALGTGKYSDRIFISAALTSENFGSKGRLYALNKSNGQQIWSFDLDAHTWSSPIFVKQFEGKKEVGTVIIGDYAGTLHAVDAQTGKALWRIHVPGVFHGSPILWEDRILIGSVGGFLHAFGYKQKKGR